MDFIQKLILIILISLNTFMLFQLWKPKKKDLLKTCWLCGIPVGSKYFVDRGDYTCNTCVKVAMPSLYEKEDK